MKTRAITGFFFVVVMLASLLLGAYTFSIFFLLLALFSAEEFFKLIETDNIKPNRIFGFLLGATLFTCVILLELNLGSIRYLVFTVPFIVLVYVSELYKKATQPFINIALTFFGIIYTVIPFLFFYSLGFLKGDYNYHYPLAFLLILWTNDTGAYLVGMKLGKNKLFERHSPKKTWEGFFGGVFLSIVVAYVIAHYYTDTEVWKWIVIALIISVFGTIGDLTESMLKRSFQVKDSGSLLPGHGGLLDRFDGLLVAAPLVYTFLYLTSS
ncbi:phosphatidate cytidylyltransferase [Olivibacter domesticus]|uniref:Phosphatidate cytidylyltransferase n=1 Tax=Olivibacter domesticus TaxID=407022 RepID=A0A1H7S5Q0_OLID1|nr:phosphatidate cytidylyltransferase [Olivibacter domesticus]SEL67932.1 phosphatidate cytidylyltransferase [Olivibacter domesticus]